MKKFVCLFILLLSGAMVFAQNGDGRVVLTLKDGTVINGYLRTALMPDKRTVGIGEAPKGKYMKYANSDIESLVLPASAENPEALTFIPVKDRFAERKKPNKEPSLMVKTFEGKHVTGYRFPTISDFTVSGGYPGGAQVTTTRITGIWGFSCRVEGEEAAVSYWYNSPEGGRILVNPDAYLKQLGKRFDKYPELIDALRKENLDKAAIRQRPEAVLEVLDRIIEEKTDKTR